MYRTVLTAIALTVALAAPASVESATGRTAALWLARSCIGEAGWKAHETGECAAIAHIYLKRAENTKRGRKNFMNVMFKYSAAIRPDIQKNNMWVFGLTRSLKRPSNFPIGMNWRNFRGDWKATLRLARAFLRGQVPDPTPEAMHFGCDLDVYNAFINDWVEIETPFRNHFYKVSD